MCYICKRWYGCADWAEHVYDLNGCKNLMCIDGYKRWKEEASRKSRFFCKQLQQKVKKNKK